MILGYFTQISLTQFWQVLDPMPERNSGSLFRLLPYILVADNACPFLGNSFNFFFILAQTHGRNRKFLTKYFGIPQVQPHIISGA